MLLLYALTVQTYAQKLKTTQSLNAALEKAKAEQKPVLLIVDYPIPANTKNTNPYNFKSAIENEPVIARFNEELLTYKTTTTDTSVFSILRTASIKSFPAYIFLRADKEVFFKDFGTSSADKRYFGMLDAALQAYKNPTLSELTKLYEANKADNKTLKTLIDARKKTGIVNNAELIEQYASNLRVSELNNYANILYIFEAGPYIDGQAYKLAYTNRKIVDSIYRTETVQKRSSFNNAMISNTMIDAAAKKNPARAFSGANFARSSWTKDYRSGERAYNNQMLWYYSAVRDTANYLRTASYFIDGFYMNLSADSIKKIEKRAMDAQMKNMSPPRNYVSKAKMDSILKTQNPATAVSMVSTSGPSSINYANELNNFAWKFYETKTANVNYLTKAMLWSRRSIELNPLAGYYDTLAHILYRLGYFDEATKTEQLAIEKAKAEKVNSDIFAVELKKIRNKQL